MQEMIVSDKGAGCFYRLSIPPVPQPRTLAGPSGSLQESGGRHPSQGEVTRPRVRSGLWGHGESARRPGLQVPIPAPLPLRPDSRGHSPQPRAPRNSVPTCRTLTGSTKPSPTHAGLSTSADGFLKPPAGTVPGPDSPGELFLKLPPLVPAQVPSQDPFGLAPAYALEPRFPTAPPTYPPYPSPTGAPAQPLTLGAPRGQ